MPRDPSSPGSGQRTPSGSSVRNGARRSVLDRILSDPGSPSSVEEDLMRDLEWLLNTRSHLRAPSEEFAHLDNSAYTYGLPDLASYGAAANASVLGREIRRVIEKFEPRLRNVSVTEPKDKQSEPHV